MNLFVGSDASRRRSRLERDRHPAPCIIAELPGVRKSDLDIQVKNNAIRIAGTKTVQYPEKASLHRRERASGRFDRAFTVPVRIDADRVKAEYHDGILALYLPRAEQDKPRSIKLS